MSDLLVVGSVALDSVKTPFGAVQEILGGSATYFSYAASFFSPVQLVAVVGEDFPQAHLDLLKRRDVDLTGLQVAKGRTFRWAGEYGYDLNEAKTLDTQLNVFADFRPDLPESYRQPSFLFLANIDPDLQWEILHQVERPRLVAMDTMNFWINGKRQALERILSEADALIINDGEARQLTQEPNLVKAAEAVLAFGPQLVVIKRGEYGAVLFAHGNFFFAPAFPLAAVLDPTGAGDSFAGGFMGALARDGGMDEAGLRRAVVYGSVMASFAVEDFSLRRFTRLRPEEIEERFRAFQEMVTFQ
ncbi:MAG: sugar kinase [Candidatus Rokubacteria bacterium]|nr:sugar kinase [Candidatus Rokubacteria bacterium]